MSTKKDIGSVIKSAMEGYTNTPDDVWGAIESKLKRQRRVRMLLILLLLLGITTVGVIYVNNINKEPESSDKTHQITPNSDLDQEPISLDSLSNTTMKETKDIINESKNSVNTENIVPNSNRKNILSNSNISSSDQNSNHDDSASNSDELYRVESRYQNLLSMLEIQRLDSLQLVIDSIQLFKTPTLDEHQNDDKEESIWRFSPFVSVDHYNAFGRSTSKQNTFNYGAYLYFYGSENLALRIGFKKIDLQYNFQDFNTASQQQVSYNEIPMEGRYFFNTEKKLKTSFVIGGSFMFLQGATLVDFDNNITRENRDSFTDATFSVNTGLGLHYDLTPKWRLNLESAFKYHLTPYSANQDFSPYNLSLSFGVEYGF